MEQITDLEPKVISQKQKDYNRNLWCDMLLDKYEEFINYNKRSGFTIPTYTCIVLAKIGMIDNKDIDFSEKKININVENTAKSKNERLIYNTFTVIHNSDTHLSIILEEFRNEFNAKIT